MNPEPIARMIDAALAYARAGYFVLPLHDVASGRCSCAHDCDSPGKHPRLRHGLHDSSTDPAKVAAWWAHWPNANIGIDCGRSGLVIVDVDVKKGAQGAASIRWFIERYPEFSRTRVCGTPSGGYHYYFTGRAKTTDPAPGIDIQGVGACVAAPPSVAPSRYDASKNPVPGALAEYHWLNDFPMQPFPIIARESGYDFNEQPSAYEGEERDAVPYGEHRAALLRAGWTLRKVLGLSVESGVKILRKLADDDLLQGYDKKHPFSDADLAGMLRPLTPIVARNEPPGSTSILGAITGADAILDKKLPPRQIIVPGLMTRGELHVFYGTDGVGKTSLMAYLLALVSRAGLDVCVFISEDQPRDFLVKFLLAGGDRARFFIYDTGKSTRDFLLPKCKLDLEAVIQSRAWGCIYFDSIGDYKAMDGRLNAADEARQLYGPLSSLAQTYDTAIVCTQHTNARDILEGSRQVRAKARVVARVERPRGPETSEEDGYDFSTCYDPDWTALVTTEKFSRGVPNTTHAFHFESKVSADPRTGEVEQELQPGGAMTPKEQYVCVSHERTAAKLPRARVNRVKTQVEEQVATLVRENPKISANEVFKQVGGYRSDVMRFVRAAKIEKGGA